MSDHPKEAKRTLKEIRICNDGCFDVFRLLPPKKVGLEVAAVSDRFDALVDTQFEHYRKWTLGKLWVHSNGIVKRNSNGTNERLPFPQIPLPNSVVGFARVDIRSFDSDAIAFLNSIGHLLQSNISLGLSFSGEKNWDDFATSILPQLNPSAIIKIHFAYSSFHHFRRVSSPSILRNCANLRIFTFIEYQSLQFPPDDSDGSSNGQALCQWLHTPRADGQPKVVKGYYADEAFPMDELKSHFSNATTPVNYIACLHSFDVVSFELVNSATHEQLSCRPIDCCWTIVRCPIDKDEKQWAEWKQEAVKYHFGNDWKTIEIAVD